MLSDVYILFIVEIINSVNFIVMEKPYSCSECSASFCRKYNLTRHQEMFHENNSADEEDDSFFKSDNENDSEIEYDSEADNESENMSVNSEPDNDEESFAESDQEDEDVFHDLIHDAITYNHDKLQPLVECYQENGLSLRQAVHKAFEELRSRYGKTLKRYLSNTLRICLQNSDILSFNLS